MSKFAFSLFFLMWDLVFANPSEPFQPYRVLGVGSSCIDILIPVSEDFLSYIPGQKGGVLSIEVDQFNQILSKTKTSVNIAPGGSCANTIRGLANLGERPAFFSHIGSDRFGEHFFESMKKLGVVSLLSRSSLPTACVLCLVTPDGQRTMRFCAGCNCEFSGLTLHDDYFKGTELLHLDAYTLRNPGLTRRAMELAKEANVSISFTLSSCEIIEEHRDELGKLLSEYVTIVFANEDEAQTITGLPRYESCKKLQEICEIAVVSLGKDGCLVGHQGKVFHSPGFPANLVDSTGAGDLFTSGFLYGYLQGFSLVECAKLGNRLGSAIVEVWGAELPSEKWEAIKNGLPSLN